jgi:hypothetical protein
MFYTLFVSPFREHFEADMGEGRILDAFLNVKYIFFWMNSLNVRLTIRSNWKHMLGLVKRRTSIK